jgi:hypothetical protein
VNPSSVHRFPNSYFSFPGEALPWTDRHLFSAVDVAAVGHRLHWPKPEFWSHPHLSCPAHASCWQPPAAMPLRHGLCVLAQPEAWDPAWPRRHGTQAAWHPPVGWPSFGRGPPYPAYVSSSSPSSPTSVQAPGSPRYKMILFIVLPSIDFPPPFIRFTSDSSCSSHVRFMSLRST